MGTGREFLGTYRVVRLIRAGATCQVLEGLQDQRRVAIKLLQPEVRFEREEINYLKHEFEVGKSLQHPNVIEVYEFNVDRGIAFLVMQYHSGKNVKMLIREGIDSFAYLTHEIVRTAALGLKYFHEQGWVHRDVKPDNFLVADDGVAKLIDFALAVRIRTGLSKLLGGRGKVAGTRSYMSPEQIRGKALDARADIYSFGCMLYELFSGRLPFTGVSPEDLLRKHLRAAIPGLAGANKNITPDFNDLVTRMMAKERDRRPKNMDEILGALQSIRIFRSQPKPPTQHQADAHS